MYLATATCCFMIFFARMWAQNESCPYVSNILGRISTDGMEYPLIFWKALIDWNTYSTYFTNSTDKYYTSIIYYKGIHKRRYFGDETLFEMVLFGRTFKVMFMRYSHSQIFISMSDVIQGRVNYEWFCGDCYQQLATYAPCLIKLAIIVLMHLM